MEKPNVTQPKGQKAKGTGSKDTMVNGPGFVTGTRGPLPAKQRWPASQ